MQIPSPCIKICKLKDNICIGCKRTIEEIKNWKSYRDSQKKDIIDKINGKNKNNKTLL